MKNQVERGTHICKNKNGLLFNREERYSKLILFVIGIKSRERERERERMFQFEGGEKERRGSRY